jgi:stringent starvation protein B
MDNDSISFQARFGGVARDISVPMGNVSAIYARENGAGMAFEPESEATSAAAESPASEASQDDGPEPPKPAPPRSRPSLQRVK